MLLTALVYPENQRERERTEGGPEAGDFVKSDIERGVAAPMGLTLEIEIPTEWKEVESERCLEDIDISV